MTKKVEWWEDQNGFFGPGYLMEYNFLTTDRTVQEIDFLEKALDLKPGARILDVPCGHGRHAIELAKRGYKVTGYDLNEFFLERARETAAATGVKVNFIQGDMRYLSLQSPKVLNGFDVVLNLFTSLGYTDDETDDWSFMQGTKNVLRGGGTLLVDYLNSDRLLRGYTPTDSRKLSNGLIAYIEREYDIISGRMHDRRTIKSANEVVRDVTSSVRLYAPHHLIEMAKWRGFEFQKAYGNFTERPQGSEEFITEPLTMDSRRAILVFQKPN